MSRVPFRPDVAPVPVWLAAAGCWVLQLGVPWRDEGLLSRSSLADAVTLVRGGSVDAAVPGQTAVLALALPVLGVLLAVVAALRGRGAFWARLLLTVLGVVAAVVAVREVADGSLGLLGAGGRLAVAGCGCALVAAALDVALAWRGRAAGPPRAPAIVVGGLCLALAVAGAVHVGVQAGAHQLGADTPEDAARELVAAVTAQDAVAALTVVETGEVEQVVDAYVALRDKLGGDDADDGDDDSGTSVTDAVSVDVSDVELETSQSDADTATVTVVGGDYRISLDAAALPGGFGDLAGLFTDGEPWTGDLGDIEGPLALFVDGRLSLTTVRVDGRWYVTGVGTAIEHVTDVLLGEGTPDLSDVPGLLLDQLGGLLGGG